MDPIVGPMIPDFLTKTNIELIIPSDPIVKFAKKCAFSVRPVCGRFVSGAGLTSARTLVSCVESAPRQDERISTRRQHVNNNDANAVRAFYAAFHIKRITHYYRFQSQVAGA